MPRLSLHVRLKDWALFVLAIIIAAGATTFAVQSAAYGERDTFTQLWVLPEADNSRALRIGITSHESEQTHFRLIVTHAGEVIADWSDLTLQPSAEWRASLPLATDLSSAPLVATLTRSDVAGVTYRQVTINPPLRRATLESAHSDGH